MRTFSKHRTATLSPSHDGDFSPVRKKSHNCYITQPLMESSKVPPRKEQVTAVLDEYQPKASKILQVCNLDASASEEDLLRKFSKFGDIIDVDICPSLSNPNRCEALVQFCDIKSVVHALNYPGNILIHGRPVELHFGKSQPTNCLWLDKLPDRTTEAILKQHFHQFGKVMDVVLDHAFMRALVYFENSSIAQKALKFTKEQYFNGEKVHVDYASYPCQTLFKSRVPVAYSWNNCDTSLERSQHTENSLSDMIHGNASVETRSTWQSPTSMKSPSDGLCSSPIHKLSDSTASPDLSDNMLHEAAEVLSASSHNQLSTSLRHLAHTAASVTTSANIHIPNLSYSSASSSSSVRHNKHNSDNNSGSTTTFQMFVDSTTSSSTKENIRRKPSVPSLVQEQHLRSLKVPLSVNTNMGGGGGSFENVSSSRGFSSPGDESCPSSVTSSSLSRNTLPQQPSASANHHHQQQQRSSKKSPIPNHVSHTNRHTASTATAPSSSSSLGKEDRTKNRLSSSMNRSSHFTANATSPFSSEDSHSIFSSDSFSCYTNESMYDKIKRRNSKTASDGFPNGENNARSSDQHGALTIKKHKGNSHGSSKTSLPTDRRASTSSGRLRKSSESSNAAMKRNKHLSMVDEELTGGVGDALVSPTLSSHSHKRSYLTVNSVFCTTPSTTDEEEGYDRDNTYYYDVPTPSTVHMETGYLDDLEDEKELDERMWIGVHSREKAVSSTDSNTGSPEIMKEKTHSPTEKDAEEKPVVEPVNSLPAVSPTQPPPQQRKLSAWTTETLDVLTPAHSCPLVASSPKLLPAYETTTSVACSTIPTTLQTPVDPNMPCLLREEQIFVSEKGTDTSPPVATIPLAIPNLPPAAAAAPCSSAPVPCIPGVNVFSPVIATTTNMCNVDQQPQTGKFVLCPANVADPEVGAGVAVVAAPPEDLLTPTHMRPNPVASSDSSLHHAESASTESAPDVALDICNLLVPPTNKRSKLSPNSNTQGHHHSSTSQESALKLEQTIDSIVKGYAESPVGQENQLVKGENEMMLAAGQKDPYAIELMDSPSVAAPSHVPAITGTPIVPRGANVVSGKGQRGHKRSTSGSMLVKTEPSASSSITDIIDSVAHGNFDMDWHLNLWRQQQPMLLVKEEDTVSCPVEEPSEWQQHQHVAPAKVVTPVSTATAVGYPLSGFIVTSIPPQTLSVPVPPSQDSVSAAVSEAPPSSHEIQLAENMSSTTLLSLTPNLRANASPASAVSIPATTSAAAALLANVVAAQPSALMRPTISPPMVHLPSASQYPYQDLAASVAAYPVFYQSELLDALYPSFNLPMVTADLAAAAVAANNPSLPVDMASALNSAAAFANPAATVTTLMNPTLEELQFAALFSVYKSKLQQQQQQPQSSTSTSTTLSTTTPPPSSDLTAEHYSPTFTADSNLIIGPEYPIVWEGRLSLKNEDIAVNMHFVHGTTSLIEACLNLAGCGFNSKEADQQQQQQPPQESSGGPPPLKIVQRMRLEASQLDAVGKKMRVDPDHCSCLAVAHGSSMPEKLQTNIVLMNSFIKYMQEKSAAGIINVCHPNSHQGLYVVHIFPPCEFSYSHLYEVAPKLYQQLMNEKLPHLLVVITTV